MGKGGGGGGVVEGREIRERQQSVKQRSLTWRGGVG